MQGGQSINKYEGLICGQRNSSAGEGNLTADETLATARQENNGGQV